MKLPSALDMGLVMVVLIGLQAFFANVPESQGWWAPAIAAALLSATKVLEVWLVTQQLQFYSALDGTLPDQTMETKTYQLKTFRVREGNDALDIKCAFVPELGGWLVRE
jgi:uncharacterized protein YqjF (DUF2071 family)